MYHRVRAVGGQGTVHGNGESVDACGQQVGEDCSNHVESQIENGQHDAEEDGQGQVFVGDDPVDGLAAPALPGFPAFHYRTGADLFDEVVTHIRQGGVTVHAMFCFHLLNAVLNEFQLVLIQFQPGDDILVALDQLGGRKAYGNPGRLGVVFDLVNHSVNAPMDWAGGAEVVDGGEDLSSGCEDGDFHQFVHTLILCRRDGDHRDAQLPGHGLDVDGAAAAGDLVHHVEGQYHGDAHFQQL